MAQKNMPDEVILKELTLLPPLQEGRVADHTYNNTCSCSRVVLRLSFCPLFYWSVVEDKHKRASISGGNGI
jgi:hypothetical protein